MPGLSPTQSDLFSVLGQFLEDVLPAGVQIFQSQTNRVSEPADLNFVIMTPLRMPRLATNVDNALDAVFEGSITGDTMTITNVRMGALSVGQTVFGTGVTPGTKVAALASGTGGVGTYLVDPSQTVVNGTLAGGSLSQMQATMVTVQLDLHGPLSADMAMTVSTLFYDDFAVRKFAEYGDAITPLFADAPRQMPFINENQQYENRWVVELSLQVNATVTIPQQFADVIDVLLQSVDVAYPP